MSSPAPADGLQAGYVRLYRRIVENPVWAVLEPSVLKVMLAFLLKANWQPKTWYDGTEQVAIPRGSFITSYAQMATFCNLTLKQVRSAFAHLEQLEFATYTRTPRWTMVAIINYGAYQAGPDDLADSEKQRAQQGHAVGHSKGTQSGTPEGIPLNGSNSLQNSELLAASADEGHTQGQSDRGGEGSLNAANRAPTKEIKNLKHTCASDDARAGALFPVEAVQPNRKSPLSPEQEVWFAQWWPEYWRHVSKKDARAAFGRHVRTAARFEQVMAATRAQRAEMLSRPENKRPHAATWLNGERWEDETGIEAGGPQPIGSQYAKWEPPVVVQNG